MVQIKQLNSCTSCSIICSQDEIKTMQCTKWYYSFPQHLFLEQNFILDGSKKRCFILVLTYAPLYNVCMFISFLSWPCAKRLLLFSFCYHIYLLLLLLLLQVRWKCKWSCKGRNSIKSVPRLFSSVHKF